jgi:peptidoglycan/LPS O-acetylase OafA/YrhL
VSILLVIASHLTIFLASRHPGVRAALQLVSTGGATGVAIFFGISGFIITTLLLGEHARTGRIDLRAFYVRRALRILPPLWAFLGVMAIVRPSIPCGDFVRALLFLSDYLPIPSWSLAHTWSLSIEEQFYLLWPLTLAALGLAAGRRAAWLVLLASPALRAVTLISSSSPAPSPVYFHLQLDAIMIGCLVALLARQDRDLPFLRCLRHDLTAAVSAGYLFIGLALVPRLSRSVGFDLTPYALSGRALAVGSVLAWSVANPTRSFGRALNWPIVSRVGLLSYSLYLWQQFFFDRGLADSGIFRWWPLRLVGAFLAAELSYRLIERPALALRNRWFGDRVRRAVPARSALATPADAGDPHPFRKSPAD